MVIRGKMSREDRAKQFMPFAALKGYENALREKEKIVVPKIELSEDMKEELDVTLKEVQLKDIVTVVYYDTDEYIKITGMVSKPASSQPRFRRCPEINSYPPSTRGRAIAGTRTPYSRMLSIVSCIVSSSLTPNG